MSDYKKIEVMFSCRKIKSFDTLYKLKAVECIEKYCKEAAVREFGVDTKRIHVWCMQGSLIALKKDGNSRRKRLDRPGRKPNNLEMEEALFRWIVDYGYHE